MKLEVIMLIIYVLTIIASALFKAFYPKLSKKDRKRVQIWLTCAINIAEKTFGAKTGPIKLSYVYDLFVNAFPHLAKKLTIENFEKYVNESLDVLKETTTEIQESQDVSEDGTNVIEEETNE